LPKLSEGFSEIVNVNFVPQFDGNSKDAALYRQFLIEKWRVLFPSCLLALLTFM